MPDLGKYIHFKTLEWTHFQTSEVSIDCLIYLGALKCFLDDAEQRLIVVGDIHGMLDSFEYVRQYSDLIM